jgi:transposase-like protein
MPRHKYDDDDRARVYSALVLHQGNARKAAEDTGVNPNTVTTWKRTWNAEGPPPEVLDLINTAEGPLAERLEDLRDKVLERIKQLVQKGDGNLRDLTGAVKTISDLIAIEKGKATSIKETQVTMPQLEVIEERIALHIAKMAADASERQKEVDEFIIEGEFTENQQPPKGLTEGD